MSTTGRPSRLRTDEAGEILRGLLAAGGHLPVLFDPPEERLNHLASLTSLSVVALLHSPVAVRLDASLRLQRIDQHPRFFAIAGGVSQHMPDLARAAFYAVQMPVTVNRRMQLRIQLSAG